MDPEAITLITKQALWLALLLSAPMVLAAALVGLLFGFIQAVTQLQDQTTSFALKILVVFGVIALLAPWLSIEIYSFGIAMFERILELR
jgi:type III secretion HrpO family protein